MGIWYAIAAYSFWGLMSLYWKTLKHIPPGELISLRIFWCLVFVGVLLVLKGQWKELRPTLAVRKNLLALFAGGILIGINWFLYIWAVNTDHMVETSLGYYINPLFNVLIGMLVLKERLNLWQYISLTLAATGVAINAFELGGIPWISLSLAVTFSLYGLMKKLVSLDSTLSLAVESAVTIPVVLGYLTLLQVQGTAVWTHASFTSLVWLAASGLVTSLPMLWFAQAAKRISLSTMGFIQYISPTITLALGVLVFHEKFNLANLQSFGFIWAALLIYSLAGAGILPGLPKKGAKNHDNDGFVDYCGGNYGASCSSDLPVEKIH